MIDSNTIILPSLFMNKNQLVKFAGKGGETLHEELTPIHFDERHNPVYSTEQAILKTAEDSGIEIEGVMIPKLFMNKKELGKFCNNLTINFHEHLFPHYKRDRFNRLRKTPVYSVLEAIFFARKCYQSGSVPRGSVPVIPRPTFDRRVVIEKPF